MKRLKVGLDVYLAAIFSILLTKSFFLVYFLLNKKKLFGGGSDADYYHAYAVGSVDNAVNSWPIFLRFLNELNLYDRQVITVILFLMSVTVLPYSLLKLSGQKWPYLSKDNLILLLVIVYYPTIFFLSMDIFRDVLIYTVFSVSVLNFYFLQSSKGVKKFFLIINFFVLSAIGFTLRPYLGFALFVASVLVVPYNKLKLPPYFLFVIYSSVLVAFYSLGLLDPLISYRDSEIFDSGGSSLGISLSGLNPIHFLALSMYSFLGQVFGLYFNSLSAVLVFILESVPFILIFFYSIRNWRYFTIFIKFLFLFFICYTTVWVLGNDNLGTAARLRVPSYLSIFLIGLTISHAKKSAVRERRY